MAKATVTPRKQSEKVKHRNKLTLEERVERLEATQEVLERRKHGWLDRIETLLRKIEAKYGLVGKVKAKRLTAKAGVTRG